VQHKLHAARLVEEALEDERVLRRQGAERGVRRRQVVGEMTASMPAASRVAICPRSSDTATESSSDRPGASPSQNGMVGGWPRASSTRTVPRSTRRIR
jgi:hypothetical protein